MSDNIFNIWNNERFTKLEKWHTSTSDFLRNRELDWQNSKYYMEQPSSTNTRARNLYNQRRMRWSKEYDNRPLIQQDQLLEGADYKKARTLATMPPPGTDKGTVSRLNQAKGVSQATTRMLNEQVIANNPDIKDSGYKSVVQAEHALSVGIDRRISPKIKTKDADGKWKKVGFNPLETIGKDSEGNWRGAFNRGGDSRRTLFPGSGAYNMRIGTNDSFTIRELRNLNRPTNWQETVWSQLSEGDGVDIDITEQDWLRLQQGKITDGELLAHKLNVEDQGRLGNIFIDAEDPVDQIAAIHRKDRNYVSPKTHFEREVLGSPGGLKSRTFYSKLKNDLNNFRLNKLAPAIKSTSKIRRADIVAQLGTNVASGNIIGASVNATFLSAQLIGANPRTQRIVADLAVRIASMSKPQRKAIQRQLLKAVGKRGVRTSAKLIPGLDIYLSGQEAWGYANQGKWDQATIATLSGAVGWFPVVGDFASALLDASNTVIDVTRMNFGEDYEVEDGADKKRTTETKRQKIKKVRYKAKGLGDLKIKY